MIAIKLKGLLTARGKSAYWLAKQTGLHQTVLSKMVNNRMQYFSLDALDRLCAALECEPGDILIREADVKKSLRKRGSKK